MTPASRLRVGRGIVVLYGALLLLIIGTVNLGGTYAVFGWLGDVPYGDKLGHFLLFGVMGTLVDYAAKRHSLRALGLRIPTAPAVLLVVAGVEELSQRWLDTRTFDLGDLVADCLGVWLFVVIGRALAKRRGAIDPRDQELID